MIESITNKPVSTPAAASPAPAKVQTKSEAAVTASPAASQTVTPISPRLRYDAVSGVVITEFLDQAGGIQAQSPSTAVVAYLRAGLGKDGLKPQEDPQ